ncbi:hypothetical protein [Mycobacterium phage Weirdo19]|uniref:Uncharacterized protein n=1 Tax=Mycobacterium phage Weirdo19 TaxID=2601610 RepID=A0A6M2YT26_9CAUD|nr:hypothetical protein KDJ11_gp82 [Mycobacterium phage Weirdo19]QEA10850.1 hypothetical protein [Mycobacterium phage Weirdo19]
MTRRFTICTDPETHMLGGRSWELDVVVHANVRAMRAAARRHDGQASMAGGTLACFQIARRPHRRGYGYLGVVRFAAEHIEAQIVIHEAVHAGVALALKLAPSAPNAERMVLAPHADGPAPVDNEERIAYATTELALALLVTLGLGDDTPPDKPTDEKPPQ